MFCPLCAAPNPVQGRFCIRCGQPLPRIAAPQPPYADFMTRFAARLIDGVVLSPLLLGWGALIFWFLSQIPARLPPAGTKWEHPERDLMPLLAPLFAFGAFWIVFSMVAGWLYHAMLDSSERQGTVGKRVMGLKVTGLDGRRISFGRASARWLCSSLITSQTMLIGYVM